MGKNNKARRAAKAKQRRQRGTPRSRGEQQGPSFEDYFSPTPRQVVAGLWFELERALRAESPDVSAIARQLAGQPAPVVDEMAEALLLDLLPQLWAIGWQPAEVRRQVRRQTSAAATRLVELAVIVDHEERVDQPVDPRWAEQVRELSQRTVSTKGPWLTEWQRREALDRAEAYLLVAELLLALTSVPPLDVLIPPPGASSADACGIPGGWGEVDDPMLRKVRGLLAKAESTEFEEEASALTAKAQELMTRHAIDAALLTRRDDSDVPRVTRVPIDAPYADAKSVLLSVVAQANRSRAVFLSGLDMSTVLGHADDLRAVELVFTSLLVQAQNALSRAAKASELGRKARSQSFRSSFFLSFAHRIEERLTSVNDDLVAGSGDALPVLRAREDAVEELLQERFGERLHAAGVRGGYDHVGHAYGRRAADEAKLDSGELLW